MGADPPHRDIGSVVRVLLVDDEPELAHAMARTLGRAGLAVTELHDPAQGLAYLRAHLDEVDVVLLDVDMPGMSGLEVLAQIRQLACDCPVVMWTADARAMTATKAMRAGAFTYVTKPVEHVDELVATLNGAASFCALRRHARALEQRVAHAEGKVRLIGESAVMQALRTRVDKLAASDVTVVILGESGTGKELVARALHAGSPRAGAPFVALNCGAIAESMIDSELFGHTKGAFTGAQGARPGLFVEADGGTLFLDEIAELPVSAQARLLRVLQEREVRPVGSDTVRHVDVRVVAATHVDLAAAVAEKRFRADLYYRLNVATVQVPPLRERASDIPVLAAYLLSKHGGARVRRLTPAALAALMGYAWPGNVRELENALLHAIALTAHDAIDDVDLPARVTTAGGPASPATQLQLPHDLGWTAELTLTEAKRRASDDFERRYLLDVLQRTHGNLTQAARAAGLDRTNFRRALGRLGLDAERFRS